MNDYYDEDISQPATNNHVLDSNNNNNNNNSNPLFVAKRRPAFLGEESSFDEAIDEHGLQPESKHNSGSTTAATTTDENVHPVSMEDAIAARQELNQMLLKGARKLLSKYICLFCLHLKK